MDEWDGWVIDKYAFPGLGLCPSVPPAQEALTISDWSFAEVSTVDQLHSPILPHHPSGHCLRCKQQQQQLGADPAGPEEATVRKSARRVTFTWAPRAFSWVGQKGEGERG